MNKLMIAVLAVALAAGSVWADTTNVTTNLIGQVWTTISDAQGVRSSSVTYPSQPSSASQLYLTLAGIQLAPRSPLVTTNTVFTPRGIGDILIGWSGAGQTGTVWMATGTTTSDWKLLNEP